MVIHQTGVVGQHCPLDAFRGVCVSVFLQQAGEGGATVKIYISVLFKSAIIEPRGVP
jgi:hypothetical protein